MCNIVYTSLVFDEAAQTIVFEGTADCNRITASIVSPHIVDSKTVAVSSTGNWTVVYNRADLLLPIQDIKSRCGRSIKVTVFCTQNPGCKGHDDFVLECVNTRSCPDINLIISDLSTCAGNSRVATFGISYLNAPDPTIVQLSYGDGANDSADTISGSGSITRNHSYVAGQTYSPRLRILYPSGCDDITLDLSVEQCENKCPSINDLQFTVVNSNGNSVDFTNCLPAGDYKLIVNSPSGNGLRFTWNGGIRTITNRPNERRVILGSGETQTISFVVSKDDCDDLIPGGVTLTECDRPAVPPTCPSISFLPIVLSECDRAGRRSATINARASLGTNTFAEAVLSVRNSNSDVYSSTTSSNSGTVSLVANLDLLPGTYTVKVSVNAPSGCPFSEETFIVPECNDRDCVFSETVEPCIDGQRTIRRTIITPARGNGRPCPPLSETIVGDCAPPICDWCCIWNWINIVFFALTAIFILVTFCMLEATAVSAILALASGGTLLAVTAALSSVNIIMLWICLGLLIAGLMSFILWLLFCVFNKPNACSLLATVMIALSTITVNSLVLSIILFAIQRFGCAAGALVNLISFGFLLSIATLIYTALGCFNRNSN